MSSNIDPECQSFENITSQQTGAHPYLFYPIYETRHLKSSTSTSKDCKLKNVKTPYALKTSNENINLHEKQHKPIKNRVKGGFEKFIKWIKPSGSDDKKEAC